MDQFWIKIDPTYPSRLKEAERIFPLLSTKEDILNIIHILATEDRIIYMDELEEKLMETDLSNVNYHELLKVVNEFRIFVISYNISINEQ